MRMCLRMTSEAWSSSISPPVMFSRAVMVWASDAVVVGEVVEEGDEDDEDDEESRRLRGGV